MHILRHQNKKCIFFFTYNSIYVNQKKNPYTLSKIFHYKIIYSYTHHVIKLIFGSFWKYPPFSIILTSLFLCFYFILFLFLILVPRWSKFLRFILWRTPIYNFNLSSTIWLFEMESGSFLILFNYYCIWNLYIRTFALYMYSKTIDFNLQKFVVWNYLLKQTN